MEQRQIENSNRLTVKLLRLFLVLTLGLYSSMAFSGANFQNSTYNFKEESGRVRLNIINDGGNDFDRKLHFRITTGSINNPATYKVDFKPIDGDDNILIPPGGTSASVSFDIVDDNIDEDNEGFYVELWTGFVGESGAKQEDSAYVEIFDNDTTNTGFIQAVNEKLTVNEGSQAKVGFRRVDGSDGRLQLDYYVEGDTAEEGDDFKGTSGSFTWADGDTGTKYVYVDTIKDTIDENDETFYVYLTNDDYTDYVPETLVTIKNVSSNPGLISLRDTDYSVREDASKLSISVRRISGEDGRVTVDYRTVEYDDSKGSKATSGKDFKETKGTLTWNDGDASDKTISVDIYKDDLTEGTERFAVNFSNPTGGTDINFNGQATVSIEDVPPEYGRIRIKDKSITIKENNGNASVVVERLDGTAGTVTVKYSTGASGDSAEKDKDYSSTNGTLSWDSGDSSSKTIKVPVLKDTLKESNESFTVQLSGVSGGATLDGQNSSSVTIQDSTDFGTLQFKSSSAKFSESSGTATIDVERSGGSDGAVSIDFTVGASNDSATKNTDYRASNGTLSWANGDSGTKQISIELLRDQLQENDETVTITIQNPKGNASLGNTSTMRATISDDTSFGNISFVNANASVREDDGTTSIKVTRSGGSDGAVSVRVTSGSTTDTASAGSDYTAVDEVFQWANGEAGEKSVSLKVLEDDVIDEDESLTLNLSEVGGGALLTDPTSMSVQIENTTLPKFGGIGFTTASSNLFEGSGPTEFSVLREGGSDGAVTIQYTIGVEGDTAEEGTDYSTLQRSGELRWEDRDSSAKTIDITILGDAVIEENETLTISLINPTGGATLSANATHTVTIQDALPEDFAPVLGILSGDQQSGFPGTVLQPFVLSVNDGETPAPGIAVTWVVEPADAGRLIDGDTTRADGDARASNTLEILKGGVITVSATINTSRSKRLSSRADENTAAFTVNAGFEGSANLNPNQREVGKTLDSTCPALNSANALSPQQQDLLNTCNTLQNASTAEIQAGIARLTPEELFAIGSSSLDTNDIQVTNVQSRINSIRLGSAGLDLASLQIDLYGQSIPGYVTNAIGQQFVGGGGSAGIGDESKLGVFVNGSVAFGTLEETENEMGLDFDTQGLTLGVDYRTDDDWVFGGALGLTSHAGDYSSEGGKLELSGTSLSAFATWYDGDEAYFDAIMSFGKNAFTVKRRINLDGQADQFATSKPDATEFSLSIGAGLEYRSDSWQYGPYGRLGFTQSNVGSYKEAATNPNGEGAGSVLAIEDQSLTSSLLVVGGQLSNTISTSSGVWIPQVRLELEHRLDDSNREIEAAFQYDPSSTAFTIESEDIDTDYLNFGTGVSAVFRNGKSGYLFYETRLGQDRLSQHWVKLGMRIQF